MDRKTQRRVLDAIWLDMARAEIRMQKIEQALDEEGHHYSRYQEDLKQMDMQEPAQADRWKRACRGRSLFFMEHDEYGSDVAGIIDGTWSACRRRLLNGYDAGALEADFRISAGERDLWKDLCRNWNWWTGI